MKKKLGVLAFVILISVGGMLFSKSFTKEEQLKLSTRSLDNSTTSEVEESKDEPILDDDKKITSEEENKDKLEENKETENEKESVENKKLQSETKVSEPSKESKSDTQSSEIKNNEVKTETKNNTNVNPKEPEKKQEPNVTIVNDITGDVIASGYVNIDGQKVETVTRKILSDSSIEPPVVRSGYFSSIAGLKERSQGKSSGWCYYVNGVKPGIGASDYTLRSGDKLVWKFLLDGISN
ncbi:DUF4430 domain-containing protein [Clostridium algidicarnis]|uniref:DUF4430 domain-containing protein n=1 Tax=Clostridium algidicarnis TaxID=37659 RepID=UPI001C0BA751|nr:DUF4430 domain-containing protein [Clostridium algidicarnis]MBU3208109.1 DUF4430 domain-containing protein [Clostridium algidicarnis]MBU3227660.1 DUF4430 domain-containing protein [Clostridium algidicarnis]MBU3250933.1 DUF4430 domain-containing protein [Clostridium algidicarnis]